MPIISTSRLARRFRVAFATVLAITSCVGATAFFGSLRLADVANAMYTNDVLVLSNLGRSVLHMKHMRLIQYRLVEPESADAQKKQLAEIAKAETEADEVLARCGTVVAGSRTSEAQCLGRLIELWRSYKQLSQELSKDVLAHRYAQARSLVSGDLEWIAEDINGESDHVFDLCDAAAAHDAWIVQQSGHNGRVIVFTAMLVGFALYGALWRGVSRRVVQPARDIRDALSTIAAGPLASLEAGMIALSEGDFSRRVDTEVSRLVVRSDDEFGVTAQAINRLADQVDSIARSYSHAREALDELVAVLTAAAPVAAPADSCEAGPKSIRIATGAIDTVLAHQADLEALADEAQRLAEEANALSRAKSDFLANMSHELRTPMNGVLGAAELLAETELQAEQAELVDIIRSTGCVLLTIVNDVLDFSRIEAGKLELETAPFDPGEIISSTCRNLAVEADQKGLALRLTVSGEGLIVSGDSLRLRQVVTNLVGNAIKFTAKGHVFVRCTTQRLASAAASVLIEVEDTGIGIDSDAILNIFDQFTQADGSTTRRFGGTGLGLAISKELIGAMGGSMTVSSEPGVGSTFTVELSLPLAADGAPSSTVETAPPASLTMASAEAPPPRGSLRALLAEDNPVNQIVATRILRTDGYETVTVSNGREALEMLHKETFDVVLMDWHMPEMDGIEATRAIRASGRPWSQVPIIALTANAMEGDRLTCLAAGMDDFISKPFMINPLLETVRRWAGFRKAA